jgi:chromate reductase, NAD(P)H dehydrogenase (quinone)
MTHHQRTVGVLLGSLRKASTSAALALAIKEIAPVGLKMENIPIGDLPLYNADHEVEAPATWLRLRQTIRSCDALLFITPEYNRSLPAVLKNAIDVGSRPPGQSAWTGKPAAIITFSPGNLGGFGANHHLRQCLVCLNVPTMPAPEVYLSGSAKLLDENGSIASSDTRGLLERAMASFASWIDSNSKSTA